CWSMAHCTLPTLIASTNAALVSKVTIFAVLPAFAAASVAASAIGAPNVTMWSIDGSCCSLAVIVAWTDGMSVPFTLRFSTAPPNPDFTPAHRDSKATLPWSWITQTTFLAPSPASRFPAASPAAQRLPGALTRDLLVLAEVSLRARGLPVVDAGVQRHHRNPCGSGR